MSLWCEEPPGCICRKCLFWWSCRCDGKCKEQECTGGWMNQAYACKNFVKIDDSQTKVMDCMEAVIVKYQDGYIQCSIVNDIGCEECYTRFIAKKDNS